MKTSVISKVAAMGLAVALGGSAVITMTGCDTVKETISKTGVGKQVASTKSTDMKDRKECYSYVQDINGNESTTVIYINPFEDTNTIEIDDLKKLLNTNNISWYQIIASDSAGAANVREHALLYFPASVTLSDMNHAVDVLSKKYDVRIMDRQMYDEYLEKSPSDGFNGTVHLYDKETTYYGPAAQQSSEK